MTDFSEDDLALEDEAEDEEVAVTFDIASYPSDNTLATLVEMWRVGDIVIPDFQREFVWSRKQSSLLIDSFLRGLPVPPVFFFVDPENKNLVIDGQQRLLSIVYFFEGYFGKEDPQGSRVVFRLSGLGTNSPYNNKRFQDLEEADQRQLRGAVLRAVNVRQLGPDDDGSSAYYIFERLNTGGTPLTSQEIRNVVYRGKFNDTLKELNRNEHWRAILGKPLPDKHQKDIELLLRVFSLVGTADKYEKPLKRYLNDTMAKHRGGDSKKVEAFAPAFVEAVKMVADQLGPKPFHLHGPLNVSALDSVLSVLIEAHASIDPGSLRVKWQTLKSDPDFDEHTTRNTTDAKTVQLRIRDVRQCLLS
jgi:hypothetical protein